MGYEGTSGNLEPAVLQLKDHKIMAIYTQLLSSPVPPSSPPRCGQVLHHANHLRTWAVCPRTDRLYMLLPPWLPAEPAADSLCR